MESVCDSTGTVTLKLTETGEVRHHVQASAVEIRGAEKKNFSATSDWSASWTEEERQLKQSYFSKAGEYLGAESMYKDLMEKNNVPFGDESSSLDDNNDNDDQDDEEDENEHAEDDEVPNQTSREEGSEKTSKDSKKEKEKMKKQKQKQKRSQRKKTLVPFKGSSLPATPRNVPLLISPLR